MTIVNTNKVDEFFFRVTGKKKPEQHIKEQLLEDYLKVTVERKTFDSNNYY